MNRKFFNLQLFGDTVTASDTLVSGRGTIYIGNEHNEVSNVTVEGCRDIINTSYSKNAVIYAGDNVTVTNNGSNATINRGYYSHINNGDGASNVVIYAESSHINNWDGASNVVIYAEGGNIDNGSHINNWDGASNVVIYAKGSRNTINNCGGASNITISADYNVSIRNDEVSNVIINAGEGNDTIINTDASSNITITSGSGNDVLSFFDQTNDYLPYSENEEHFPKNITITDFDVNDVLCAQHWSNFNTGYYRRRFAKFDKGVLNIDNALKIKLPNVKNINDYRNMTVRYGDYNFDRSEDITLGELLDSALYWKVSGTTATASAADGSVVFTLTGLKSGLKVVDGEIPGIRVDGDNNVILSKEVLDKKTVSLNVQNPDENPDEFYYIRIEDTVPVAEFENFAWNISGTTATYRAKCKSTGYYITNGKLKYFAKDAANTVATINGIKSGTKVNSDGSITGISANYENYGYDSYGSVDFSDSAPISDKVTVSGDELSYNFGSYDGDGTDIIKINNHTVTGGANGDNIRIFGDSNNLNTGAGNDNIYVGRNFWGAEYASNNNTVIAGVGNDSVYAVGTGNKIDGGAGDDFASFNGDKNYIDAGAGDDTISAHSGWNWEVDEPYRIPISKNTLNAGAGDDLISTTDAAMTSAVINAGAGNDTIEMAKSTSNVIDAGDGNDYISVLGDYSEDWDNEGNYKPIYNLNANDNTISAGKGDDTIHIGGKNNVVQYASGDGNDTIFGYNSDDTLQIAGSYSTQKSGSDLIVKVGTGAITLKDVNKANIETVAGHIVWTASGTTATGKIDGKIVATITGLKKGFKADSISDSGSVISISQDALGTAAVKLTKGNYTLALANDVEESVKTLAHWNVDGSSATYRSLDITKGYTVATNGKSITYVSKATVGKDLTTVEGLSENVTADDLTLKGKVVTVKANALGTDEATISNGYTFKLDTDVTKSVTTKASWAIDDDSAEYTTAKVTEGYVLSKDKKSITHNEAGGGEMVATIDGLKKGTKANAFSVKNNVITVAKTALNPKNIITLDSEDYTLAVGGGAKKSVTSPEGWYISGTTASYNTEKTTAGYALFDDSKTVEYISEVDGGDTLVKLTGLKARTKATSLSIEKKVVTIGEDAINVKTAMTATAEGYEIKLSSAGKITAKSENMTLTGSSGNDTLLGSKYADVLKGGTGEDYLSGGNGADKIYGDGDDTLIGGLGKDSLYSTAGDNTLTGGSGADEFYFKDGNAIITDYTAGSDKIYLQGTSITKTEVNGKNVVFTTSTGTITVKNGANKKITVDDVTQKYSASSSGLFAEDNFVTADSLSSIVENNSVGEFEFSSPEKLTQENLITFAEK